MSALHLSRMGSSTSPWGGYAAACDGVVVGECAFKSAPFDGRVEIAYHTFDGYEGRGFGAEMARQLVAIAQRMDPSLTVVAQTLSEANASTTILQKIGFTCCCTIRHPDDGDVLEWRLSPPL